MTDFVTEYVAGVQDGLQAVFNDPASPRTWGGYVAAILAFYLTTLMSRWGFRGARGGLKMALRRYRGEHLPLRTEAATLISRLADASAWNSSGGYLVMTTSPSTAIHCRDKTDTSEAEAKLMISGVAHTISSGWNRREKTALRQAIKAVTAQKAEAAAALAARLSSEVLSRL